MNESPKIMIFRICGTYKINNKATDDTLLTYIFMSTVVHQRALQSWVLSLHYISFAYCLFLLFTIKIIVI